VNLIEEQYLAIAQIGEDGGEVALDDEGRTRALLKTDVELLAMIVASVVFPRPGGRREHMVQSFAAGLAASRAMASCSLAFDCPMNSRSSGAQF